VYRIQVVESERGWGQRYEYWDGYETLEKAIEAYARVNAENTSPVAPDWYMKALSIEKHDEETNVWFRVR
jgi:hypothetical protein